MSNFTVNGGQVTVNLTGVSNAQRIVITLFGVSDGMNTSNVNIPMGVLLGDTSGNGSVNASDVSLTKLKSGQPVDACQLSRRRYRQRIDQRIGCFQREVEIGHSAAVKDRT